MPREQNLRSTSLRSSSSQKQLPKWVNIKRKKTTTPIDNSNNSKRPKRGSQEEVSNANGNSEKQDDTVFTTRQEEAYVREMIYDSFSSRIDNAVEEALNEIHSKPLVRDLRKFFQMVEPPPSTQDEAVMQTPTVTRKKHPEQQQQQQLETTATAISSNESSSANNTTAAETAEKSSTTEQPFPTSIFPIDPPTQYSPTILPIAILHTPSSVLDRRYIVQSVSNAFQTTSLEGQQEQQLSPTTTKLPAVCHLRCTGSGRSSSDNTNSGHHGDYMYDLLVQCISQEPCPSIYASLITNHNAKSSSATQSLLTWAQHTETFDSIVILIENIETFSIPVLQDLLQLLSSLRHEEGVPICVVAFCIGGGSGNNSTTRGIQQIRSSSSSNGMVGWLVKEFIVPSSLEIYNRIWELLWIGNDTEEGGKQYQLPILIQPSILRHIRETFVNHISSAVGAACMIKQVLAHHLSQPGSYLLAAAAATSCCSQVMATEGRRVAWLCADEYARETFFTTTTSPPETEVVPSGKEILQQLDWWNEYQYALQTVLRITSIICRGNGGVDRETPAASSSSSSMSVSEIMEAVLSGYVDSDSILPLFEGLSKIQILMRLLHWRKELVKYSHHGKQQQNTPTNDCNNNNATTSHDEWNGFRKSLGMTTTTPKKQETSLLLDELLLPLNELIVLVDSGWCEDDQDNNNDTTTTTTQQPQSSTKKELAHLLVHWVQLLFSKGAFFMKAMSPSPDNDGNDDVQKRNPIIASCLTMSQSSSENVLRSMSTDIRKSISSALLRSPDDGTIQPATCEIFSLIHNRMDISRQDWYELFIENYNGNGGKCQEYNDGDESSSISSAMASKFAFGIYELLYCGLIRQKRGNTKNEMYEKATLVWCNGDK